MKVIVTQYGARRRYLIPQILESHGMLKCLYTDSHSGSMMGKVAKVLTKLGLHNISLDRLSKRNTKLPKDKVRANDRLQMKLLVYKLTKASHEMTINTIFEYNSSAFIRWGCDGADWLYAMYIETFAFTQFAKSKGLKVLADIYENPYIFKDLANEIERFPELHCLESMKEHLMAQYNLRIKYIDKLLETADQYLIPSVYVKNALKQNSKSFSDEKVNIIPYVSSVANDKYGNSPIKGRIIWIGNDPVRKGLVYMLRAAKVLKEKYPYAEFRIIGPVPSPIVESEDFKILNFLGYMNKEQLKEEFNNADMYVFPTLGEGFAGSLLEAASFGVPIITTHASGFDEDFPGLFIRERNVNDIVDAVSLLLEDREKRDTMSHDIFDYSQKFNKDFFKDKLLNLLQTK